MEFTGKSNPAPSSDPPISTEEEDLLSRNAVKIHEKSDDEIVPETQMMQEDVVHTVKDTKQNQRLPILSYKERLMGYNGISNAHCTQADDHMIIEDEDDEWTPSEDLKKLMEIYPVVPITNEEWKNLCKPALWYSRCWV